MQKRLLEKGNAPQLCTPNVRMCGATPTLLLCSRTDSVSLAVPDGHPQDNCWRWFKTPWRSCDVFVTEYALAATRFGNIILVQISDVSLSSITYYIYIYICVCVCVFVVILIHWHMQGISVSKGEKFLQKHSAISVAFLNKTQPKWTFFANFNAVRRI